ncbi:hypothetical protein FJT64_014940 [Amphibalanus amphitrite]|uniref:Single domain-containing protein n=1 Tax=Amphibalanus amphitrite TaxID=1232801 RepID=A0A6A4XHU0_AMPAM|nr:hypothetical protein FJT64_014940 [Amphibalanus amphitrite]
MFPRLSSVLLVVLLAASGLQQTAALHTHQEYFSAPATAGHSGECQDNKAGKSAKLGETWTTTGCKLATCVLREDLNGEMALTITEDGCPILEQQPGCRQTSVSRTKPFPDCCPKLRCRSTTGGKVVVIPGSSPGLSSSPSSPAPSRGSSAVSKKRTGQTSGSRRKFPKYQPRT